MKRQNRCKGRINMPDVSINRKKKIKELIKLLHAGKKPDQIKEEFKDVLRTISPTEIARIEEELIAEGMPREQIRRLCDIHLAVFKESLEKPKTELSPSHPIHTFMEEHKIILQFLEQLKTLLQKVKTAKNFNEIKPEAVSLKKIAENLMEIEKHNVREENVLFPHLEKHGISEPPAIMWAEHNELRDRKKRLIELTKTYDKLGFNQFQKQLIETVDSIVDTLTSHIYKENNILYPAALTTTTDQEWKDIRRQCDELGYCCFTPEHARTPLKEEAKAPEITPEGLLTFETGNLSKPQIEAVLNTLPVDITFVDANDTIRYFSKPKERLFPRTKAIIGRKVQQCHPPKSIHIVNRVIDDLTKGRRQSADFWLDTQGKKIYIRYFPVRNEKGEYLGVLEVSQDITEIQKIKGERRLLDETSPT